MYIFLEGVLVYEIKLLFNYYISDIKVFGLLDLNNRIQQFCYGYFNSKNKFFLILERDLKKIVFINFGQSVFQMWLLLIVLFFILVEFVDIIIDYWRCLIFIIEFMFFCLVYKIFLIIIVYLKRVIKGYFQLFKFFYGNMCNVIFKQYYLIYLFFLIFKFGFFIRFWCMRFEVKYVYFKDQVKIIKNFKNLLLFLLRRYQFLLWVDYINVSKEDYGFIFRKEMVFGLVKVLLGEDMENVVINVERFIGVGSDRDLFVRFCLNLWNFL